MCNIGVAIHVGIALLTLESVLFFGWKFHAEVYRATVDAVHKVQHTIDEHLHHHHHASGKVVPLDDDVESRPYDVQLDIVKQTD